MFYRIIEGVAVLVIATIVINLVQKTIQDKIDEREKKYWRGRNVA